MSTDNSFDVFKKFISFNQECPVCGEPLKLYMQWMNSVCFELSDVFLEETCRFIPYKCNHKPFSKVNENDQYDQKDFVDLNINTMECSFGSEDIATLFGDRVGYVGVDIYFFLLCNRKGFKHKHVNDYEITLSTGCYYRSSINFTCVKEIDSKEIIFGKFISPKQDLISRDEAFCFRSEASINDLEKIYMLNLDYEDNKTTLWYRSDPKKELFKHEMSLVPRPDFSSETRSKLINKFDNWILLS